MSPENELPVWRKELDAIVGARAHGEAAAILPRLQQLDARHPNVAEINHQLAWTCEVLGHAADALPHYEKAVALGLPPNELSGALIGLASAFRHTGQAGRAVEILRDAQVQFPENREIDVFLALALHAAGHRSEAFALAITTLLDTTEDSGIGAYQRTLRHQLSQLGQSKTG